MHVEHLRGARYGLYAKQNNNYKRDQIPVIWDSVDCISTLFEKASAQSESNLGRLAARFELGRTRQYETWLLSQFDKVVVTSPTDRNDLAELAQRENISADITVVPNGVDLNYFTPIDRQLREQESLVVSGKMSYHANVTMVLYLVREIMPLVWTRRPNAKLTIVGKDPPREIEQLSKFPQITVTGTVSDIRPYLQKASIATVPIRYGAGIQNKALEAMACGTPVIASPKAVDSLSAVPERDLLVAEDTAAFAEKIVGLLDDNHRRRKIGIAGRKYVEDNHHWGAAAKQLEQVYRMAAVDN
jgi:glycosyltransferase involved in cell wall biosynthesis